MDEEVSATLQPQEAMGRARTRLQGVASWMQIHKVLPHSLFDSQTLPHTHAQCHSLVTTMSFTIQKCPVLQY